MARGISSRTQCQAQMPGRRMLKRAKDARFRPLRGPTRLHQTHSYTRLGPLPDTAPVLPREYTEFGARAREDGHAQNIREGNCSISPKARLFAIHRRPY